jgi:arylsulfatase A-like enzyme
VKIRLKRNHFAILVVYILLAATLVSCTSLHPKTQEAPPQVTVLPRENRPNIILIIADDLDLRLGTLDTMPNLQKLLIQPGLSFENFYVTNSLCCPSRSTFLRGQYTHNHEIYTNIFPTGGFEKFYETGLESSTLAAWLQSAGYRTVLLGKYLNGYPMRNDLLHIPPGWSEWYSPSKGKPYSGFNYTLNENGKPVNYGNAPEDYLTDVIAQKSIDFIERASADKVPFFLYLSTYAPHEPPKAAYRHRQLFLDARAPQTPSFNEADVSDKPSGIQGNPLLTDEDIIKLNELYINRLQSMQAVDELIPQLIQALEKTGSLNNTYIIFTSDNGYHLGQHRLKNGKATAYLEDIQVPFIVRGPGITAGRSIQGYVASNIDFAPTIADLAGVIPPAFVDGRSLTSLFPDDRLAQSSWRQAILLEYYRVANPNKKSTPTLIDRLRNFVAGDSSGVLEPSDNLPGQTPSFLEAPYKGLITPQYKYVKYDDGFIELYDLQADPYELVNISSTANPAMLNKFSDWLNRLITCAGTTCREADSNPP